MIGSKLSREPRSTKTICFFGREREPCSTDSQTVGCHAKSPPTLALRRREKTIFCMREYHTPEFRKIKQRLQPISQIRFGFMLGTWEQRLTPQRFGTGGASRNQYVAYERNHARVPVDFTKMRMAWMSGLEKPSKLPDETMVQANFCKCLFYRTKPHKLAPRSIY